MLYTVGEEQKNRKSDGQLLTLSENEHLDETVSETVEQNVMEKLEIADGVQVSFSIGSTKSNKDHIKIENVITTDLSIKR